MLHQQQQNENRRDGRPRSERENGGEPRRSPAVYDSHLRQQGTAAAIRVPSNEDVFSPETIESAHDANVHQNDVQTNIDMVDASMIAWNPKSQLANHSGGGTQPNAPATHDDHDHHLPLSTTTSSNVAPSEGSDETRPIWLWNRQFLQQQERESNEPCDSLNHQESRPMPTTEHVMVASGTNRTKTPATHQQQAAAAVAAYQQQQSQNDPSFRNLFLPQSQQQHYPDLLGISPRTTIDESGRKNNSALSSLFFLQEQHRGCSGVQHVSLPIRTLKASSTNQQIQQQLRLQQLLDTSIIQRHQQDNLLSGIFLRPSNDLLRHNHVAAIGDGQVPPTGGSDFLAGRLPRSFPPNVCVNGFLPNDDEPDHVEDPGRDEEVARKKRNKEKKRRFELNQRLSSLTKLLYAVNPPPCRPPLDQYGRDASDDLEGRSPVAPHPFSRRMSGGEAIAGAGGGSGNSRKKTGDCCPPLMVAANGDTKKGTEDDDREEIYDEDDDHSTQEKEIENGGNSCRKMRAESVRGVRGHHDDHRHIRRKLPKRSRLEPEAPDRSGEDHDNRKISSCAGSQPSHKRTKSMAGTADRIAIHGGKGGEKKKKFGKQKEQWAGKQLDGDARTSCGDDEVVEAMSRELSRNLSQQRGAPPMAITNRINLIDYAALTIEQLYQENKSLRQKLDEVMSATADNWHDHDEECEDEGGPQKGT